MNDIFIGQWRGHRDGQNNSFCFVLEEGKTIREFHIIQFSRGKETGNCWYDSSDLELFYPYPIELKSIAQLLLQS